MMDFGIWQGHLIPAIRPAHRHRAGDHRILGLVAGLIGAKASRGCAGNVRQERRAQNRFIPERLRRSDESYGGASMPLFDAVTLSESQGLPSFA